MNNLRVDAFGFFLGEEYIPFNEMPELKNIVLTGEDQYQNSIEMMPKKAIGYGQDTPVKRNK